MPIRSFGRPSSSSPSPRTNCSKTRFTTSSRFRRSPSKAISGAHAARAVDHHLDGDPLVEVAHLLEPLLRPGEGDHQQHDGQDPQEQAGRNASRCAQRTPGARGIARRWRSGSRARPAPTAPAPHPQQERDQQQEQEGEWRVEGHDGSGGAAGGGASSWVSMMNFLQASKVLLDVVAGRLVLGELHEVAVLEEVRPAAAGDRASSTSLGFSSTRNSSVVRSGACRPKRFSM